MLRRHGIAGYIDCTRHATDEYRRAEHIQEWVNSSPTRDWVAIDDLPMFGLGKEHYIGTNPNRGLTSHEADQAIRMLNAHDATVRTLSF